MCRAAQLVQIFSWTISSTISTSNLISKWKPSFIRRLRLRKYFTQYTFSLYTQYISILSPSCSLKWHIFCFERGKLTWHYVKQALFNVIYNYRMTNMIICTQKWQNCNFWIIWSWIFFLGFDRCHTFQIFRILLLFNPIFNCVILWEIPHLGWWA